MDGKSSYKVSVIVPVYGVERYVERCVRSLMEQTLDGVEFIFVDDCSPDRSMEIVRQTVAEYPHRQPDVKFPRHEVNRGLPAARNTGLSVAQGEYIFHCDSDDFVERKMLKDMHEVAVGADADMVWCDWFLTFEKNERTMTQPDADDGIEAMKKMLGGGMKYNVWNKIVRKTVYERSGIRFPEGHSMGEDMTMIMLASQCGKTAHVAIPLYHYIRTNSGAMTHQVGDEHMKRVAFNVNRTIDYLRTNVADKELEPYISFFLLGVKLPLLMTSDRRLIELWRKTWPEANRYIASFPGCSRRIKIIQRLAANALIPLVQLHYLLIYKIVYGIIYR